jgi:hypothetical protein
MPKVVMPHTIATQTIDLPDMISFINFFLPLERWHFLRRIYPHEESGQYRKSQPKTPNRALAIE